MREIAGTGSTDKGFISIFPSVLLAIVMPFIEAVRPRIEGFISLDLYFRDKLLQYFNFTSAICLESDVITIDVG